MSSDAYNELVKRARGCGLLIGKDRDPHEPTDDGVVTLLGGIGGRWEERQKFPCPTVDLVCGLTEKEWRALRHTMIGGVSALNESVRNRRASLVLDLDTIRVFDNV